MTFLDSRRGGLSGSLSALTSFLPIFDTTHKVVFVRDEAEPSLYALERGEAFGTPPRFQCTTRIWSQIWLKARMCGADCFPKEFRDMPAWVYGVL